MKTVAIRGDHRVEKLLRTILSSPKEELLIVYGRLSTSKSKALFLVNSIELADEEHLSRDWSGLSWDGALTAKIINRAEDKNLGIVLIHAHGNRGKVQFSKTDSGTKEVMLNHFNDFLPGRLHGYAVVGDEDIFGEFAINNERLELTQITSIGDSLIKRTKYGSGQSPMISNRHDRQTLAIGKTAAIRLMNSKVAIVGLGGAGSMVAEQLAHLGVGEIVLVDGDNLEETNLSRVVGSRYTDIEKRKTIIAKRLIKSIDPNVRVKVINDYFPTNRAYKFVGDADFIISCVDKVSARTAINTFCKRYLIPFVDVGVTITTKQGGGISSVDGQIVKVDPRGPCLRCVGIVSDALQREEDIMNYGTNVHNPQVITFNGILASLASTELLKLVTGTILSKGHTIYRAYDGTTGTVESVGAGKFRCEECRTQYAMGEPVY